MNYSHFPTVIYIFMCYSETLLNSLIKHTYWAETAFYPVISWTLGCIQSPSPPSPVFHCHPNLLCRINTHHLICSSLIFSVWCCFTFQHYPHFNHTTLLKTPVFSCSACAYLCSLLTVIDRSARFPHLCLPRLWTPSMELFVLSLNSSDLWYFRASICPI